MFRNGRPSVFTLDDLCFGEKLSSSKSKLVVNAWTSNKTGIAALLLKENKDKKRLEILHSVRNCPMIVPFIQAFEINENQILLFEKAQFKDLEWFLERHPMTLDENEIQEIFIQVMEGLSYLHSKKISHKKLQMDNILVFGVRPWSVRIGGLSEASFESVDLSLVHQTQISFINSPYFIDYLDALKLLYRLIFVERLSLVLNSDTDKINIKRQMPRSSRRSLSQILTLLIQSSLGTTASSSIYVLRKWYENFWSSSKTKRVSGTGSSISSNILNDQKNDILRTIIPSTTIISTSNSTTTTSTTSSSTTTAPIFMIGYKLTDLKTRSDPSETWNTSFNDTTHSNNNNYTTPASPVSPASPTSPSSPSSTHKTTTTNLRNN